MKKALLLFILTCVSATVAFSQPRFTYKIKADSVLITNDSCTAELNLENSTKNVLGFLYNRGKGRTEFRKALIRINDTLYELGADTINLSGLSNNAWQIIGNAATNPATNFLGTTDNNGFVIRTNNLQRMSVFANGTLNINANDTSSRPAFRIYPNGDFAASATNDYTANKYWNKNGIRYNKKLGILEVGVSNNIDTSIVSMAGPSEVAALIVNSAGPNTISGQLSNVVIAASSLNVTSTGSISRSIVAGDNITVNNGWVYATPVIGEAHLISGGLSKTFLNGWGHIITGADVRESFITGSRNYVSYKAGANLISGALNADLDSSYHTLVSGAFNTYSGNSQLLAGLKLISRGYGSTALGIANVEFSSLPPVKGTQPADLYKYPLLAIGNSNSYNTLRSNAFTILHSGRTQINTTGHTTALTESDVTPKAALEVVSNNSGILIPRLTTAQRDAIVPADLHNSLLLYNTDSSKFQYYNGSIWKSLNDISGPASEANIYNSNGTITDTVRTVELNTNRLNFNNGNVYLTNGNLGVRTATPTYPIETPDSIKVGTLSISKRGYGGGPTINTTSFLTLVNDYNTVIHQSLNPRTPQLRFSGPNTSTVLDYSGAINGLNFAAPTGISQPLLITTSAFAIATYPYAGNIILRPGTNSSITPTTDYVTQYTHDSVLIQLNGRGVFSVNKKTYLADTLQTPNIISVARDTTLYKPVVTDANGNHYKTNWTGGGGTSVNYAVQALTESGSTITWNAANGINGTVTLTGTGRTLSITNPVAGMTYTIRIIQDGIGGRTITTWPANSKWPGGSSPTLSTVAGRYDIVVFYYDGTNYYGTYQQNFQ